MATEGILHPDRARFDARQFVWIGSAQRETQVLVARSDAPVRTFDEAFQTELILGGSSHSFPTLTNAVLGTKFKLVSGYPGTREATLALEPGEVQSVSGTWATVKTTMGGLLAEKKLRVIGQYGLTKNPELPDVGHVLSFAKTPEDRSALLLLFATQEFGQPYIAPPGLPPDIANTLRSSFLKMLEHPEFLAGARKKSLDIEATSGEEIQRLVEQLYATPSDTVDRVRKIFAERASKAYSPRPAGVASRSTKEESLSRSQAAAAWQTSPSRRPSIKFCRCSVLSSARWVVRAAIWRSCFSSRTSLGKLSATTSRQQ
jgi:hypothetical protein